MSPSDPESKWVGRVRSKCMRRPERSGSAVRSRQLPKDGFLMAETLERTGVSPGRRNAAAAEPFDLCIDTITTADGDRWVVEEMEPPGQVERAGGVLWTGPVIEESASFPEFSCLGVDSEVLRAIEEVADALDLVRVSAGDLQVVQAEPLPDPRLASGTDCRQV